jgi:hypothetical protein
MDRSRFQTRSLSQITANRAPKESTSVVSVGANDVGPSSKDLSFVLNNFKEIEKVSFECKLA